MKVYSIGREVGCDIVINDSTDVISRRHATLNVSPSGKMTIVDLSHNGTYVNGIRISQNVPVPVTRKDNISFAHVARLDWKLIPNTSGIIKRWILIGVLALLVIIGLIFGISALTSNSKTSGDQPAPAVVDTLQQKMEKEKMEAEEKHKRDSIEKHVKDSIDKVRGKATKPVKKEVKPAPKPEKPKPTPPSNETPSNNGRGFGIG